MASSHMSYFIPSQLMCFQTAQRGRCSVTMGIVSKATGCATQKKTAQWEKTKETEGLLTVLPTIAVSFEKMCMSEIGRERIHKL